MDKEVVEPKQTPAEEPAAELGSGVYVDVENLQDAGQEIIKSLLDYWPDVAPKPSLLNLYVRADHAELWNMWAESEFPEISITSAKGIQHFSKTQTKNSADIAMAIDAMSDFLLGRIVYVVVVSDDSDFISLYAKVRDEQNLIGCSARKVPFLWVLTDRSGTRSETIKTFFPNSHIHILPFHRELFSSPKKTESRGSVQKVDDNAAYLIMAKAIIDRIPAGEFKSTDCREIIRDSCPDHPLATAGDPTYGTEFYRKIFPILQSRGVDNPGSRPRRYYMSQQAKDSAHQPPTPAP